MTAPDDDLWGDVFDAADHGLVLLDRTGRIIGWNAWMVSATGVQAASTSGKSLDEVFTEAHLGRLKAAISDALNSGASSLLTHTLHGALLPLKTRAGVDLVHNVSVRPVGQKPYGRCLVQVIDVTDWAYRERLLRARQNARYDAVVESAPDPILTLDADGMIQTANPAASGEFGYASHELVGQPIGLLLKERTRWDEAWQAVLSGEGHIAFEMAATRKDGSPSYVEASAGRWLSASRVFVTVIFRDVNERHSAREALLRLNQTLERRVADRTADRDRMWRLSTDIMMVAQLDGTINAVNPAWTLLFGWNEDELIGARFADLLDDEGRATFAAVLAELSRTAAPRLFVLKLKTRDQADRWIEWSGIAGDGLLQAVGRDVTAEREAAQALQETEAALRQSQKMEAIGQLTGGIAHDFNNLLTGIIGAMDILKRRIAAGRYEDTPRFMDAAVTSANRAAALTHRLLAFARRQPLDPKVVDVNQLVKGMEDMLRRTLGERIQLATHLPGDLWPTLTDAHQLENAILNLAINARDAMPDGGRLTIATVNESFAEAERGGEREIEPGEYSVIAVSDTGVGMSPSVVAKVFEPFFTTKPLGQGTGLGLSMIYGFVKQSHGEVRVESEPGAGTTIKLYLRRHTGPLAEANSQTVRAAPSGDGETVLLVEDDSSVRLLIGEVLRDLGYACIEASDGQTALPMLVSNVRLDLMITDVGLPGLNGRQLADLARQHRPGLKVLFVTGYAEHATGGKGFLEPGMAMVTKPFTLDALALKIREILGS
ncbi:MAG TPA: PAS domain S-box protein [Caulobacteraceae bacterium]|jgi:PAS domain S-box-containing protein|nr:PAS domain S-box protein [Caulobacteraceae bacterium]